MNIVKKIYNRDILAALDFGAESVVVLIAEKKAGGGLQIIGAGDAASHGVKDGEVVHTGDAAESIIEALKKAENSSGFRVEKLYFNFDDAQMQSVVSSGSKLLGGEGEIQGSDIDEARKTAERLVGDFNKSILYSREIRYVLDGRDDVTDPVGAFGKKLDVLVHVLQARSSLCEGWQTLMKRSQIARCMAVPSSWSTAYGVLPDEDRVKKRLIVDLGNDFLNSFIFVNNRISACKVFLNSPADGEKVPAERLIAVTDLLASHPDTREMLLTGDQAGDKAVTESFGGAAQIPFRVASPQGFAKLNFPKYASVAGLLYVADEMESKMPILRAEKGIFSNVREKTISFINEYF